MILVPGATGNAGAAVVRALLDAGERVLGLVRREVSAPPSRQSGRSRLPMGVEAVTGDLNEPGTLRAPLQDVRAVFLLSGCRDLPGALAEMRRTGVERVVLRSRSAAPDGDLRNAIARAHPNRSRFFRFYADGDLDESNVLATVQDLTGRPPRRFEQRVIAHADRFPAAAPARTSPNEGTLMTENTPTTQPTPVAGPVRSAAHRDDGDGWTGLVLGAALVAMALVAGLCFTFSVAVMPNLADADDRTFVATMQRFNDNPVFQIGFAAALVLMALGAVLQRRHGPRLAVRWTVAALVLYGIVIAVTFGLHIPLNNDIDQAGDPDRIADLADVRNDVEGPWVAGNIPRTLLAIAAVAALARALFLHGRSTADRTAAASATGPS